jgi:hypothetical protein
MADNVDITAGTGTTIATDDCTTGHVQLVKLAYGADGNRTQVAADADGLLVNLGTNNDVTVTGTVTANLAAGTNNIGDVDVLSVPAPLSTTGNGTAATALRVSLANDSTGIVALTTSSAAIGKLAANDGVDVGDVTINNASGGSAVNIQDGGNSITVDGTVAVSNTILAAAGSTSIAKAEDVLSADGDVGVPALAVRKATPANTSGTDGDYEFLQMSAGRLWTSATIDAALPAGTNAIGKLAANSGVDIGDVDVLTMPNVTLAATTNTIEVVGDIAHDTGVGGNPVQVAGAACALADSAPGNRVSAAADVTRLATSLDGGVFVHPHGPQMWSTLNTGSLSGTSVKAAGAAGLSHYITALQFSIGAATASSIKLTISGGADIWGPHYLEAVNGRGVNIAFNPPLKVTAATAFTATTTGSTTCTLTTQGYTAPG